MTHLAGTVALAVALGAAVVAAVGWGLVAAREPSQGTGALRRTARVATMSAWVATGVAVTLMEVALVTGDTGLAYAAEVSRPELPLYYRVTALWSALEGSLLLWLLAFATVALVLLRRSRQVGAVAHAVAMSAATGLVAGFAAVTAAAGPFAAAAPGAGPGPGPNPLLQDHPAMGVHPPLLYAGFAVLAAPFALCLGALVARSVDEVWARAVRGWTLVAWTLLGLGIGVGAWWSYAVLGWGGYWAWDPVENASLLPWLVATALLHAVAAPAPGTAWRAWSATLAGTGLLLVVLATFLTRSGVVQSVHAFSESALGPLLLVVLGGAGLPWLALMASRRDHLVPTTAGSGPGPGVLSRQTALRANAVLLCLITATVLLGTVLPAVLLAVTGDRVSVGPPWYARTVGPTALTLLVLMAVGPWVAWNGDDPRRLLRRVRLPAALGAAVTGGVGLLGPPDVWLAVCSGLAAFVVTSFAMRLVSATARGPGPPATGGLRALRRDHRRLGSLLAHSGIALGAVAVLAGLHGTTTQETVPVGGTVAAGSTSATLISVERSDEGRRSLAQARLLLAEGDRATGYAHPQLRYYPDHGTMLTGPVIRTEALRDVYVTLLDVDPAQGTATVRLAVTPLTSWLWGAGLLTVLGGVLAAWPARSRSAPGPATGSGVRPDRRPAARAVAGTGGPSGPSAGGPT